MKTRLLFLVAFLSLSFTFAQEITVNTTMGASYSNQLFYKLSTETETSVAADSWDIAMLRTSAFDFAIRVNGGIGIEVFQASNNPADWATIDVANQANWTQLYNSDTDWKNGAFQQGTATYGWGEYNFVSHHVEGTVIFVLKYADGTYKKFINEDFYSGYTFKYSTWNGTTWSADQTVTIPNTNNPNNAYNYYSLQNNQEVTVEPAISDWDLKFTRYYTDVQGQQYLVTGVLHSDKVEVAQNDEPSGMPTNPSLTYSTDINTIGYDWKTLNFTTFTYDVHDNQAYYIKYQDDTVYRLYFSAFSGGSSGNLTFHYEDVTSSLSLDTVDTSTSFGIYPNPSKDGKINLIYDVNAIAKNNSVEVFSTTGQKVYSSQLKTNTGFYNKTLDLSALSSGMYMVKFISGEASVTKKLILK